MFADDEARRRLNAITHPAIAAESAARIFIKRPEYDAELMPLYAAGRAQGVLRYSDLAASVLTFPPGP